MSEGQIDKVTQGSSVTREEKEQVETELGTLRSEEVRSAIPEGENQWSTYSPKGLATATEEGYDDNGDSPAENFEGGQRSVATSGENDKDMSDAPGKKAKKRTPKSK